MQNLLYEAPKESVRVGGKEYRIVTDFRDWIRFFDMQEDEALSAQEKLLLAQAWFLDKPPLALLSQAITALLDFALRREERQEAEQAQPERKSTEKILSWKFDSAYVYAGFLSVYHLDLLQVEQMHWHVFLALFDGLPDDTPIKQRMQYRSVNLSAIQDKNERKRIRKIQERIRIPRAKLDAAECGAFFG